MLCSMMTAWAQDDGFVTVASASQLRDALKNDHAKVRLTADIYLSDLGADFDDTFCSTFYGVLDGDGHAIKGDHYADNTTERRNRNYLFTYSEGATFKNLTFKHIRKNSQDHSNQAIITSQAKNNCVFENITFENVGNFSNYNNVGAAAGYAYNSTFTNITVKNSDFTVDDNYVGSVVGDADKCTFTNIEIINCKTYAHDDCAGGVVGHSRNCKFMDVAIKSGHIQADGTCAGGVAGKAVDNSCFTNCVTYDQASVYADGTSDWSWSGENTASVGGIAGYAEGNASMKFINCINSAILLTDMEDIGGIVGYIKPTDNQNPTISGCLNTGMIVGGIKESVALDLCDKYKNKKMTCVTKNYNGIEYTIRISAEVDYTLTNTYDFGGIVGECANTDISQCTNLGILYTTATRVGGIAGYAKDSNITDCLVDFLIEGGNSKIRGTDGGDTAHKSNILISYSKGDYHYRGYIFGDDNEWVDNFDDSELLNGSICLKLGNNWEQNLGTDVFPTPTGRKRVYHTREVSHEYGTVCLPIPLWSDEEITYYRFAGTKNVDGNIVFVFTKTDIVIEGEPVLFRASRTGKLTFNDGILTSIDPITPPEGEWTMVGTYVQKVFGPLSPTSSYNVYYVSDGVIRNAKKTTIAPYRAYFEGPSIDDLKAAGAKAIQIEIEDEDGQTTALELVGNDLVPVQGGKTYSVMGTEVDGSYRGIVIKNGKKVVVK